MSYDNKRTFDKNSIKIRENQRNQFKKYKCDEKEFCYKMYNDWIRKDSPVDIPVLIMDNESLMKNKDVDIIPRLYAKYTQKNISIPFIFHNNENKYATFKKYFKSLLNKEIPNANDFKNILVQKQDLEKNRYLFESVNIFLYTSFLLKQFSAVMNIIPHFYSPIQDETKYYFYIVFDYMRRECIRLNKPLMKSDVIELIRKIASFENEILNKELFLNTFSYIDKNIFHPYVEFHLITENKRFHFSFIQDKSNEDDQDTIKIYKNIQNIQNNFCNNHITINIINNNNNIMNISSLNDIKSKIIDDTMNDNNYYRILMNKS